MKLKDYEKINAIVRMENTKDKKIKLTIDKEIVFDYNCFYYAEKFGFGDIYEITYKEIIKLELMSDDSMNNVDLLKARVVSGAFGAIAKSMSKSLKYFVVVVTKDDEVLIMPCKSMMVAENIYHTILNKSELKTNKMKSNLEIKLHEIEELYRKGILKTEEYESKRKQIIEKY